MAKFKPKMFLYDPPFVVDDTPGNQNKYRLDYLNEQDRADEERIRNTIFKFALDEEIIKPNADGTATMNILMDTGSWRWRVQWLNFRSLVDMVNYGQLMTSLRYDNGNVLNQVIDLHTRLGVTYDHRVLNTMVDRIMKSITVIPYDTSESQDATTWEVIHQETPYIWLLILLQTILKSSIVQQPS
jgi:hypothetical protein